MKLLWSTRLCRGFALSSAFVLLGVLILIPAATVSKASPGRTPRLEELLPFDTVFFGSIPDVDQARTDLARTGLAGILKEDELQPIHRSALGLTADFRSQLSAQIEEMLGMTPLDLLNTLQGQLAVAVLPAGQGPCSAPFRVLFLTDPRQHGDQLRQVFGRLLAWAQSHGQNIDHYCYSYRGAVVSLLRSDQEMLAYTVLGSAVVGSLDEGTLLQAINRYWDGPNGSLAMDPVFARVRERVTGNGNPILLYARGPNPLGAVGTVFFPSCDRLSRALGFSDAQAIGIGVTFEGETVRDVVYVDAPGERKGLLKILSLTDGPITTPALAPETTLSFRGIRTRPVNVYDEGCRMLREASPALAQQLADRIRNFEAGAGIDVRSDLVANLGNEMALFIATPMPFTLLPDVALVLRGGNPERLLDTLAQIAASAGKDLLVSETDLPEGKLYLLDLSAVVGSAVPFDLVVGESGDVLVFTLSTAAARAVLARASGAGAGSLADAADYAATLDRLGVPNQATYLEYTNLRDGFLYAYGLAEPFLLKWLSEQSWWDSGLLPLPDPIARHLLGAGWSLGQDEEGITLTHSSPLGDPVVLAFTLLDWMLGRF